MELAASENMLLNRVYKRTEQIAAGAYPAGQSGARDLNSLSGIDLRLSVQQEMIAEFRNDHVGKKTRAGKATLNRT